MNLNDHRAAIVVALIFFLLLWANRSGKLPALVRLIGSPPGATGAGVGAASATPASGTTGQSPNPMTPGGGTSPAVPGTITLPDGSRVPIGGGPPITGPIGK